MLLGLADLLLLDLGSEVSGVELRLGLGKGNVLEKVRRGGVGDRMKWS